MGVTICLNMIVRDEAHIVAECLASVAPFISTWVIVDTGSTDNTIELIRSFFAERGIPGEIFERPWVSFDVNRSEALKLCGNRADYIWVIDADDRLIGTPDFSQLSLDSYLLRQGDSFRYWRRQIFRSNLRWIYEGVLHEYPVCLDEGTVEARLEGDYFIDGRMLGARSRHPDKFLRDAQTLLDALKTDPDNSRYVFYLAQSYWAAGDAKLALEHYTRRAAMGGFDEEVYYSQLLAGECLEKLEEPWERALDAYLKAWQFRPQRAEALHRIARHYRRSGEFHLAHLFAERAAAIPFPDQDNLFVGASNYEWEIADELSIAAYYVGRYRQSFDTATALLEVASVPEGDRERILANRDFAAHFVANDFIHYPHEVVTHLASRNGSAGTPGSITLTITSCRRRDLFERTVNSFLNCVSDIELIDRWICIDDGSSSEDRAWMAEKYPFFEFVLKSRFEKGHANSMNMLLERISTPYWLHLEDDWQFFVRDNYISKFLEILADDDSLGQVLFNRNFGETLDSRTISGGVMKRTRVSKQRYRVHEHLDPGNPEYRDHINGLDPGATSNAWWPHYSLRPSLLRMSAIRDIGAYDPRSDHFELHFAQRYLERGYRSAFLDSINCLHIGRLTSERSVHGRLNAYALNGERQFGETLAGMPARVRLLTNWTTSAALTRLWNRQSRGDGRWDEVELTEDDNAADYWAIINFPTDPGSYYLKDRSIVFQMEPAAGVACWGAWSTPDRHEFLQVRSHDHYPNNSEWHLGINYHELTTGTIEKTRDLSVVTSGKTDLPGQQLRILLFKYLEEQNVPLDIFGADNIHNFRNYHGPLPLHDKRQGILPYRYTIAIENSAQTNYFTEKLIDGILGECLCFYWGCPNVDDYLDPQSYIRLPIPDFESCRQIIVGAIESGEWEKRLEVIRREKTRILERYQFFPTISRVIQGHRFVERLQIAVINLDRREDRWRLFCERVAAGEGARILDKCERVPAVDGLTLQLTEAIRHTFRGNVMNDRRSVIGCALSHLALWQRVADSADDVLLVLEDDVLLSNDFYGQLIEVCGALSQDHPDFDLVTLGYSRWDRWQEPLRVEPPSPRTAIRVKPINWQDYLGGSFAYLISAVGARRLLAIVERDGIQHAIDTFKKLHGNELKVFECEPFIVHSPLAVPGSSIDSDIQHDWVSLT